MNCVVCRSDQYTNLLNLDCGGFDNSPLYKIVKLVCCDKCYHVFNFLSQFQIERLNTYYNEEYSLCNLESPNKKGDIPGSSSNESIKRYKNLFNMISENITSDSKILDVGCALGGFLNFISAFVKNENLYGIDSTENFVNLAKKSNLIEENIKCSGAESIPFDDGMFDILVIDQVIEHLVDPNIFFSEANRVIKNNGILCISLPKAQEYVGNSFFDFYFFLMREHIQHFGFRQLRKIAGRYGFSVINCITTYPNLISEIGTLPNLTLKFIKDNSYRNYESSDTLKYQIIEYIDESFIELIKKRNYIQSIDDNISIFGMSREFHYLYQNTQLNQYELKLYDDIKTKQNMKVNGLHIFPSELIDNDATVFITSYAHIDTMKNKLINQGFKGKFI